MLEALGTTPDRFQSLVDGLTTDQLARRPKEGEWSIAEILNHLLVFRLRSHVNDYAARPSG